MNIKVGCHLHELFTSRHAAFQTHHPRLVKNSDLPTRKILSTTLATLFIAQTHLLAPLVLAENPAPTIHQIPIPTQPAPSHLLPVAQIQSRLEHALLLLTKKTSPATAWLSLLPANATIGLRVSASQGRAGGTRQELVEAVARSLAQTGFKKKQIIVWDRNRSDLLAAGYSANSPHYTLRWIESPDGFDPSAQIQLPIPGKLIFGDRLFTPKRQEPASAAARPAAEFSNISFFSLILTSKVTHIINIPSASDSIFTGIHGALAGIVLSNLDNWRRFANPPDYGDPWIAKIYAESPIAKKVVLTILDAITIQYAGGPLPNPQCSVAHNFIYLSRDPVALDDLLLTLLDPLRREVKLPPVSPLARHVQTAAALGLGQTLPPAANNLQKTSTDPQ